MINYSQRARIGYARLYRFYNDIDVFVEDSSYVGVYERLINRILKGKATVTRVIPLGPRSDVEAAAAADPGGHAQPRIYLVDGDLDLLAFRHKPGPELLYRLKVYSLENLVAEVVAMDEYGVFATPGKPRASSMAAIDVPNLAQSCDKELIRYFACLAIARRLKLRGAMFAINAPSVSIQHGGQQVGPCPAKIKSRVRDIVREMIRSVGHSKYRRAKDAVAKNISAKKLTAFQVVPGKIILGYLNGRVIAAGGMSMQQKAIVSYLSSEAELTNEPRFAKRIRKLAGL